MTEEATVPEQRTVSADEQVLLRRLRAGEDKAFSELFELHAAAVRRLARGIANDASEAEDITAETFFRVLQALRRGSGPRDHVRAYLLTVARRVSWEWHGARRDVPVTDDELTVRAGAGADAHARTAEHSLIATAFTSLPERWRSVLWQTEVEGEQPAVVAPHFGLSANATAALARRARQGLRAAYLQAHLAMNRTSDVSCRGVIEKLGGYTAGSVTGSEAARIRTHLRGCSSCQSMHDELTDVCSSLRSHAGVLAFLVPATATAVGAGATSGSGTLAAVKGVLLSKLKIGIAVASTAAAGVVGATVGPALLNPDHTQAINLPQGGIELQISPMEPSLISPPPGDVVAPDEATLNYPGPADTTPWRGGLPGGSGNANGAPVAPPAPPPAPQTDQPQGQSQGQGRADAPDTGGSSSVNPRVDTGSSDSQPTYMTKSDNGNHGSKSQGKSRSDQQASDQAHNNANPNSALFRWFFSTPTTNQSTNSGTTSDTTSDTTTPATSTSSSSG
ncbi:sigma-70 family RNA polymerase sigma factor [Amycolatopsis sp. K13G38]|uniref:Sigma-70 family RNA polymerase sigma factor n=1 Tax=Amycolatopsis acididurans TaxID=2724524 RepID=A0ABX1J371_9PSEU|nr:sigma-70 family RNA polymerase sigma factor [Amycolatopsis acididurans]NKQ53409.1 sigma-70 family RNA polymerase sigma factor [Amycolatopsis acididurans]